MDYTSLVFGIVALGFGFYTGYLRITNKMSDSAKLTKMKELMGDKAGNIVHLIAYTILPIIVGVVLLSSVLYTFGLSLFLHVGGASQS